MRVRYTRLALAHLRELDRTSTAQFGEATAQSTLKRIENAVADLALFPERGRQGRVAGTRELIITGTPFVVAYVLRNEQVQILAVLHGARKWPAALR